MKFKYLFLIYLSNFLVVNCIDEQVQVEPEHDFVLLIHHNSKYLMGQFLLSELKKCQFPDGPLRANIPSLEDFQEIDKDTYEKLHNFSHKLQIFCIEDGIPYKCPKNDKFQTFKKCGFEVPGQTRLHYVFFIKEEIKNISGHYILRSEIDILQKKEQGIELTLEEAINDPDLELAAETKREDADSTVITKVTNYARLLLAVLYIQYLKITDYFGRSSDLKKNEQD